MAARGARNKKIEVAEAQTTLEAVKDLRADSVVSEVNNLQVSLQKTLADVSASITNKIQQIDTIDTAISLKEARLKELYGIEAEAIKWDDLQAQHDAERKNWEVERETRNNQWEQETDDHEVACARRSTEWEYLFAQRTKQKEDAFKAQVEQQMRAEKLRQEDLQRAWQDRENALKAKETEYVQLREQVAGFDARLKAEVAKTETILSNTLKKQHEHEKALLQKDAEAAKALCESKLAFSDKTIAGLENQIATLKAQLDHARQDAKDVANQALNTAADRRVAEALRQVVSDREQVYPPNKK